ncbi:zinc finger, CCHC-type containing protein [Tanacetum coccineum]|uniref:Zinc finger, CCHC-type containing protein n=1 Tax=Tanacetum coccineum TaxID=301880 RepID=A0ABQ4WTM9_9ASTR
MGDRQGDDCSGDLEKLEDVLATLNSRELQKMTEAKGDGGERLYVRRRSGQKYKEQDTDSVWSKSQGISSRLRCYICQSEEHLKRDCPSANVMMAMSVKELLDWIINSRGSYHMAYKRDYLLDFEEYYSGNVLLGDGRECRVRGTGKVRVQIRDGLIFVLDNVRYVSKLRRNLISLGNLEKEGFTVKMQSGKIKVIRGSLVVLSGTKMANRIYTLDSQVVTRKTLKGRKHLGEYQTGWKIKTEIQQKNGLVEETNVTLLAKVRCSLIQSGLSKVFWAEDITMSIYLVNRSPSSAIGFKTPIDMLRFFSWLASIKLDDVTSKVLQGVEFEVELQEDHTFEVEPHGNVDHVAGSQEVQTQYLIYYHLARDREQHSTHELFSYREDNNEAALAVAIVEKIYGHESLTFNNIVSCEVISKWKARLKDDMDAQSDVYVLSNGCKKCSDESNGYYWEYTPGMFIHLFLYIDDMVFSCGCKAEIWATKGLLDKAKGNILEGHSILSLEGSLLGYCDVEKNDAGMLDKFDRGLQTNVHVFVDFDYAMGRSITVMGRSITRYGLMIQGCAGS